MENSSKNITVILTTIVFLCLLNLGATGYLIKIFTDERNVPKVEKIECNEKDKDELSKKLDRFFEKQDEEMKKLFEEKTH